MRKPKNTLSKTEKEVARLNILGHGRKEIAKMRFNSEGTIRKHLQNIHEKTGASNVQELCIYYLKEFHEIDLRKVLVMIFFLGLLSPEILYPHSDMVRTARTTRTSKPTRGRKGRKDSYDYDYEN